MDVAGGMELLQAAGFQLIFEDDPGGGPTEGCATIFRLAGLLIRSSAALALWLWCHSRGAVHYHASKHVAKLVWLGWRTNRTAADKHDEVPCRYAVFPEEGELPLLRSALFLLQPPRQHSQMPSQQQQPSFSFAAAEAQRSASGGGGSNSAEGSLGRPLGLQAASERAAPQEKAASPTEPRDRATQVCHAVKSPRTIRSTRGRASFRTSSCSAAILFDCVGCVSHMDFHSYVDTHGTAWAGVGSLTDVPLCRPGVAAGGVGRAAAGLGVRAHAGRGEGRLCRRGQEAGAGPGVASPPSP